MVSLSALAPLDAKLLRDWWAMKSQALAIALVLAAGIGMVVMAIGMIRALEATRRDYYADYRLADVFVPMVRADSSLVARAALLPGVAHAEGRVAAAALVALPGAAEPASARLLSLPPSGIPAINAIVLRSGRWPDPQRAAEVVVSEPFANANRLAPGDRLSLTLRGRRIEARVVGTAIAPEFVYALGPGQIFPDNRRFGIAWMAQRPLAAALDLTGAVNELLVRAEPGVDPARLVAPLDRLTALAGGRGAFARRDLLSEKFLSNELRQLATMSAILPPVFLAVAAFLLHNVLLRTIEAERQEIGLLMAFGLGWRPIAGHYARLAVLLMLPGLLLGLALGHGLGRGLAGLYRDFFVFPYLRFHTGPDIVGIAALVAGATMALGLASALRRVARLTPADAMRPALPTRPAGAVSRALLRLRAIDEPSRIIVRGLVRRPGRCG